MCDEPYDEILVRDLTAIHNGAADACTLIAERTAMAIKKLYGKKIEDSCEHCPNRGDCQVPQESQATAKS